MKEIVIIGAGGHAKVLIEALESSGEFTVKGLLDARLQPGSRVLNYPVLGNDDLLWGAQKISPYLAIGLGMIKIDPARKNIFERAREAGYQFPVIAHAGAVVSKSARLGEGVQVLAGAVVQACARIGENTVVNTSAVVEHDCHIGAHCHLAPGAILGGEVRVGDLTLVGLGARILPGIKIGSSAVLGAGSVVTREVRDHQVVAGIPAREMKR